MKLPLEVSASIAPTLAKWFEERGGVIAWPSHDLSFDCGQISFTPLKDEAGSSNEGKPPTWRHSKDDFLAVTDPAQIVLLPGIEIERRKVKLRMRGMKIELTAASSRKVEARLSTLQAHHPGAWYEFDPPRGSIPVAGEDVYAVYFRPGERQTLKDWRTACTSTS